MQITRFQVFGLFGRQDVEISIQDNRVVIVGVNGAGKSTLLNLLYFLLARRWEKLGELHFDSIGIEVDGHQVLLSREEIRNSHTSRSFLRRVLRTFTNKTTDYLENPVVQTILAQPSLSDLDVHRLSQLLRIPRSQVLQVQRMIEERGSQQKLDFEINFNSANRWLTEHINAQILYLPTYRRIEKDLKSVVPDIEERVRAYDERYGPLRQRRTAEANASSQPYIDLVEFGMDDVKQIIESALQTLNDFSRQQLNELTGAYLREVVRGEVDTFELASVTEFDDKEINSVLARVDERTLSSEDKKMLREVLGKLHQNSGELTLRERYIAHFFAKLGTVARRLQEREEPIRNFVSVCNDNYLVGKQFVYDRNQFTLAIEDRDGLAVELKDLSSGEKQVISLFTHIHLGGRPKYIIIIDEPELSLSVDWQSNLLPDIMASGRCVFLAAVTHSPFIYENEFEKNTVDLLEKTTFSPGSLPL